MNERVDWEERGEEMMGRGEMRRRNGEEDRWGEGKIDQKRIVKEDEEEDWEEERKKGRGGRLGKEERTEEKNRRV